MRPARRATACTLSLTPTVTFTELASKTFQVYSVIAIHSGSKY